MNDNLYDAYEKHRIRIKKDYNRDLPFQDTVFDRWERAESLGFGENSNIYNSAFVFGDVSVGKNVWIGPNVILDGSAAPLVIGDGCTIAAGVHIYTHDNILKTLSGGKENIQTGPVTIGLNTYIGSQSIINKNVNIGNMCVVAANSFVSAHIDNKEIHAGNPAKKIGYISEHEENIQLIY